MSACLQRDQVCGTVEEGRGGGARRGVGRIPESVSVLVQPMIIDRVTRDRRLWRGETFGPVLPVMRFADEANAIRLANDSEYGLCASVFSADRTRAMRVATALEVGGISINNVNMSEEIGRAHV